MDGKGSQMFLKVNLIKIVYSLGFVCPNIFPIYENLRFL